MQLEWDENKSKLNRKSRGFGFEIIEEFNWDFAICVDLQNVDHEERELWLGPIGDKLYAVVLTMRDEEIVRIISMRHATQRETVFWREEV